MEFVGERVEVETGEDFCAPRAVIWRGRRISVKRVLRFWHDFSYGPYRYLPRRWWLKRRRLYFDVEFEDGRVGRLYRDMRRGEWVLLWMASEEGTRGDSRSRG